MMLDRKPFVRPATLPLLLLLTALSAGAAAAQESVRELPIVPPPGGCRSEMDGRLAFGLCPDSTFDFYASGEYRPGVPRPEEVLGYPIGSWHTTYGRMERFIDTLARAVPERVRIFPYGRSVEQQTLYLLAISSEQNIARLEEIRATTQRVADPRQTGAGEAQQLISRLPTTVWLNSANDGNESAAFEAVIQLAYQLAAGEDARTRAMREGSLILINMAHNPESHERHVAWYNAFVMGDSDPRALEHRPPWGMSTNNNHYQFDLNRDALGLTQTESRAVAAEMQRWRPQVFVDLHGQTTQYFFPPAADPISPLYPPQLERWLEVFGRGNAAAFDQHGWSYYTRDVFDLFYPGYWDTYPSLHGATGMTYETDGGGTKGVRWRRDDGTILTFADGIAHHFVASLATIETAVRNREARLRDFHDYFASAVAEGRRGTLRTVVLLPGNDPERAARLATTLLRHGVEVRRVTRAGSVSGTDYLTGARGRREVPMGAYLVDLAQPNGRIARTLLAPEVALPQRFVEQELARFARNMRRAESEREREAFYDLTAWSLPLAGGVSALWSGDGAGLASEPLALPPGLERASGGWASEVAWLQPGGVSGRAQSAYVWAPGSAGGTRLLSRLLDEGFNVAVVERGMVVGDTAFPRGSYIARVERNRPELHERIDALAREAGVRVHAAATAFPERGPTGIGSEATRTLRAPRIAVVAGEGVSPTSYGALWFHFERRIGKPFTALRTDDLTMVSLDDFDVLILPDGRGYRQRLGERGAERLREWAERGGTLIGYAGGATYLMEQEIGSHAAPDTAALPSDTVMAILRAVDARAPRGTQLPISSPEARPDAPLIVPGAFLRGWMDLTHWLTFGYGADELPLLAQSLPLRPSTAGANPVIYATGGDLRLSGFVWPDNTQRHYAGRPYATVDGVGQGRLILLAEDPLFRGVFDAPAGLLMNAILLGAAGR
ncbi:M14 family zinc carboxypeptidase [soil metagenome]